MADGNQMDQGAPIPPQAGEKAQRGVTHAREAAEDLRSAANATTDEYRAHADGVWDDARRRVRSLQDDSKQYVRENPAKAVLTALGLGFEVGLISHR
jgi:ElaB/YqjD/DUF883 family membrane-anchored ribosome-binding protein